MMMQQERGETINKPERPNSLGPKLSKRINFYHDNCKFIMQESYFLIYIFKNVCHLDQDNQRKTPDNPTQSNNNPTSNGQILQQHFIQHQQLQQQLQHHLSGGFMVTNTPGPGMGGSGSCVANNIVLSELPEPPISVSDIGPIPPPAMFSSPSPTMVAGRPHGLLGAHGMLHHEYEYDG